METSNFLRGVITTDSGHFCLFLSSPDGLDYRQIWFEWPKDITAICQKAEESKKSYNVYYSVHLFDRKKATKECVIGSRTIVVDLDEADIYSLPVQPFSLVETSPKRHQGYWVLRDTISNSRLEQLSKNLTYAIPGADRGAWNIGRVPRLPGTYNHKYQSGPKLVNIIQFSQHIISASALDHLSTSASTDNDTNINFEWANEVDNIQPGIGPQELLEKHKTKLPSKVIAQYNREQKDRSAALWAFMNACFRAGLTRDEVFWLSKHNANNKFKDLRYNQGRDLARDVLRAESQTVTESFDIRSKILSIRRSPNITVYEKRQFLSAFIKDTLNREGEFVHATDGTLWYVQRDNGRPVQLSERSEKLDTLLEMNFGLNAVEQEQNYVVKYLISQTDSLQVNGVIGSLSYFDTDSDTMYLHSGARNVLKITQDQITTVSNGEYGIVFPWSDGNEAFSPDFDNLPDNKHWSDLMFDGCLDNLIDTSPEQAKALLQVWLLFIIFRNAAISRPILAAFGQPGAGKSTLLRRVYRLIYGKYRELSAVSNADNFDTAVSRDPIVVYDNLDSYEKWLPDRLAMSVTSSEVVKRKLYTDVDTVTLRRQAVLGLTAHSPKFIREDVIDRMLILEFTRLRHFEPESNIMSTINDYRSHLWGSIIKDIQRVLRTPLPNPDEVPQWRVEDFARIGYWISCALGIQVAFTNCLSAMRRKQQTFTLNEEVDLISALVQYTRYENSDEYRPIGYIWNRLNDVVEDRRTFTGRIKNAQALHRKLWAMQETLKDVFIIEWMHDSLGSRLWRIKNGITDQKSNGLH